MEDELIDLIVGDLFSESPNIIKLQKTIGNKLKLTSDDADDLLYKTVAGLNKSLFPPIEGIELVLTEGCNLACSYCFEKNMLGYRQMPLSVAKMAIDLLFKYSNEQSKLDITYFGGEPMLNFPAIKFATEYALKKASSQNKSIYFNTTTNGILLTDSMINYFYENKIKVLLSIDGVKETHDKFRVDKNGKGTFAKVYENLKLLKEKQPWVGIKMTVMPTECSRLFNNILELHDLGVNQFIIGPATGVHWSSQDSDCFLSEMKRIYDWYIDYSGSDLRIAEFEESKNEPFFGCHAGRTNIAISTDGQISPCSKILAIENNNLISKLGDVYFGLFNFRNRSRLINCSELRSECDRKGISEEYRGGCFATNYYETKNIFHPNMHDYYFEKAKRLKIPIVTQKSSKIAHKI
jgi:uncharacterized protein